MLDNYLALEQERVPRTRQHLHQYLESKPVGGASIAFVFFVYVPFDGSKVVSSGRCLEASITSAKKADEVVSESACQRSQ